MAYVLVLLATLGIFIVSTPARKAVGDALARTASSIQEAARQPDGIGSQVDRLKEYLRGKISGFIRQELHKAVDGTVR